MTTTRETVAAILEAKREPQAEMIPTRYPFTYAYDFVRQNARALGFVGHEFLSRGDASKLVKEYAARTGEPLEDVLVAFADGLLAEENVVDRPEVRAEALRRARQECWRSLGYETAPVTGAVS